MLSSPSDSLVSAFPLYGSEHLRQPASQLARLASIKIKPIRAAAAESPLSRSQVSKHTNVYIIDILTVVVCRAPSSGRSEWYLLITSADRCFFSSRTVQVQTLNRLLSSKCSFILRINTEMNVSCSNVMVLQRSQSFLGFFCASMSVFRCFIASSNFFSPRLTRLHKSEMSQKLVKRCLWNHSRADTSFRSVGAIL